MSLAEQELDDSGFFLWFMADRFYVVSVRIEDESPVVARMVVGTKPGAAVVAPARSYSCLVEGIDGGAVLDGEGDVEGSAHLALAYPEVGLTPQPETRCKGSRFHDQLIAEREEGFAIVAFAALEVRDGYAPVIQHRSHLLRP